MAKLDFSKKASFNKSTEKKEPEKINIDVSKNNVVKIPVSLIEIKENIRNEKDDKELEELADTIREYGLQEPVIVYENGDGKYTVKMGHRRVKACKIYDIPEIDCIIAPAFKDEKERLILQAIENEHRINMTAKERETYMKRMIDLGMTQAEIAKALHKPKGWISESLKAFNTREENADIFENIEGEISTRTAYTVGNLTEEEKESVFNFTKENGNTAEALKKAIEEEKRKRKKESEEKTETIENDEINEEFGISFDDTEEEVIESEEEIIPETIKSQNESTKIEINIAYDVDNVFKNVNIKKLPKKTDIEKFIARMIENYYIEKGFNVTK